MGLAIGVGDLAAALRDDPEDCDALEQDFDRLNAVLRQFGLPTHTEPRDLPELEYESVVSFPYSFLHFARRMYARLRLGKPAEPVVGGDLSAEDDTDIESVSSLQDSHLLYHSDCDGYYVPIDFERPLLDEEITGGAVGSTQGLLREINLIAPLIGIELAGGEPTAAALEALRAFDESHPFHIERVVWHTVFENCKFSLKHRSIIAFS